MGVSLNIMKRELEAMGNVSISSDGSLNFENARLYLGESSIAGDDILYVCSTSEDCESVRGYGRHAAFVDHHATKPDQTAVLSVTGGEGTLQVFNVARNLLSIRDVGARYGRGARLRRRASRAYGCEREDAAQQRRRSGSGSQAFGLHQGDSL